MGKLLSTKKRRKNNTKRRQNKRRNFTKSGPVPPPEPASPLGSGICRDFKNYQDCY